MGAQLGGMLMGTVDTMMVGRVSVEALAAAAIANAWIFALLLFGQGFVHGIDPLVTQAHGAGRGDDAVLAAWRGALVALATSVPLAALCLGTEQVLVAMGQTPALAAEAQRYTLVQIPSIPAFLLFVALRQYLQGREIVRPTLWITLIANLFNVVANYVLIFGALGMPALGLLGAGLATGATRFFMLGALALWIQKFERQDRPWPSFDAAILSRAEIGRVLGHGLPTALQMGLEVGAFSAATLVAGRLGAASLAAHTIVLNMAALAFMMPLGLSQGAVTRVGNLIGAREPERAQRAAGVALVMGGAVMSVSAISFVIARAWLPRLYTADAEVIALGASILPIAACFQIFDGVQVVGGGILRGMGKTRAAATFNLVAFWLIGLPVGSLLALHLGWALQGLWWGLCLGLALVAVAVVVWVRVRGPASLITERLSSPS